MKVTRRREPLEAIEYTGDNREEVIKLIDSSDDSFRIVGGSDEFIILDEAMETEYTINIGDYIVIEDGSVDILNEVSFGFLYDVEE